MAGPALLAVALWAMFPARSMAAQGAVLDPASSSWEFTGDTRVGTVDGSPSLLLRTGQALRRDVSFDDGVIEFEYRGTDERAFLGVVFRAGEDGTADDVYLRLHKSKQPDAVQYTPDYRGRGQWQLFHGPEATAFATLDPDTWTPVRISVAGDRAAVTVGDATEPQLVIGELLSGRSGGFVGFWANQPGADESAPLTAALRDIRITHGTPGPIASAEPASPPEGVIRAWGVSPAFLRSGEVVTEIPAAAREGPWSRQATLRGGLLPLEPHVERPEGDGVPAVVAAVTIDSDVDRTIRLDLGFSDDASVFLDDRLLYSGRHSFSTNFPRRQGLVTLDQVSLYLPLESGRNTLMVAVSEIFGGWAVMGRIPEREGLTVRPMEGAGR